MKKILLFIVLIAFSNLLNAVNKDSLTLKSILTFGRNTTINNGEIFVANSTKSFYIASYLP